MKIVFLSDTHNKQGQFSVPDGDAVFHAGDMSFRGTLDEIRDFAKWYGGLPHKYKVFVPGNHDWGFEDERAEEARKIVEDAGIIMLIDQEVTIEGLRIYGSPYQPEFCNWAFNVPRGSLLAAIWAKIPSGIDVLITHGPAYGIMDMTDRGQRVGCADLLQALDRIRPRVHQFGHIHEGYGYLKIGETEFVNSSVCDARYRPVNEPITLELSSSLLNSTERRTDEKESK